MYRPTYIEIDGNIIEHNAKEIMSKYQGYKYYFAVVKNNAYHHGIYIINYLINAGINYLAVSSLEEALEIRKYNLEIPVLCLEPIDLQYIHDAVNNNITITVSSFLYAKDLDEIKLDDKLKVHLKVDSGMSRLGIKTPDEFDDTYKLLCLKKNVEIEGVYTHLATSGVCDPYYDKQVASFSNICSMVDLSNFKIVHIERSLSLVQHDKPSFCNGVRLGICLYGFEQKISEGSLIQKLRRKHYQKKYHLSTTYLTNNLNLKFPLKMFSKIIEIREIEKDDFVGYGAGYVAKDKEYIATIPVGYADGVVKEYKYVWINEKKYDIVAECMDMIMIRVDNTVNVGDTVEVIGDHQNVKEIASRIGLVGHKYLNMLSFRPPRVYKYKKEKFEIKY